MGEPKWADLFGAAPGIDLTGEVAEYERIVATLREHVEVGGTRFDHERRTTYRECACGARCYALVRPDHAEHVAVLLISPAPTTPSAQTATEETR